MSVRVNVLECKYRFIMAILLFFSYFILNLKRNIFFHHRMPDILRTIKLFLSTIYKQCFYSFLWTSITTVSVFLQ